MVLDDPPVESEVVVDHPIHIETLLDGRTHGCPVEARRRVHGSDRLARSLDEEAVLTVVHDLGRRAITGVPHAIASTTLKPNGSSKLTRCNSALAPPSRSWRLSGPTGPTKVTRSPSIRGSTSRSK